VFSSSSDPDVIPVKLAGRAEVAVVLLGLIAELRDRAVYASSEPLAELADRAEQRLKGLSDE
jgi:hypothetical protein